MGSPSFLSKMVGFRVVRVIVCAALLISVLTIVALPELDLDPTALRAWRIALLLLLQLTTLLVMMGVRLRPASFVLQAVSLTDEAAQRPRSRLAVACCLLC
jgi:hypothetical protein